LLDQALSKATVAREGATATGLPPEGDEISSPCSHSDRAARNEASMICAARSSVCGIKWP
jgi:hypothetical protein